MKNIEIITTQNVVLQYELAPLRDRILAFVLDFTILFISFMVMSGLLSQIFRFSDTAQTIVLYLIIGFVIFYSLILEMANNGQSLGKRVMKIQVIKLAGGRATFSDYAARWVFRLIDIYFSLGGVASILIMSSAKAQRIGDIVANTAVVKLVPKVDITLNDLLAIHQTAKYVPKYLQARKLHEQDALLIKSALDRYRKFNNASHLEAVATLSGKVQEILGIENVTEERTVFLQTILQDYVVLSR